MITSIQGVVNNSTNCGIALGIHSVNPSSAFPQAVPVIRSNGASGAVIVAMGSFGDSLKVTNLEFTSASPLGTANQYLANLRLTTERVVGGGGAVGSKHLNHDFPLAVTIDPAQSNRIIGCSGQSDTLWQKAANGTDIYYAGGNVGVGTSAPAQKLDVAGVLSSGKIQVIDVVVENDACSPNGLIARNTTGLLLSCQSGTWKKASGGGGGFWAEEGAAGCPAGNIPGFGFFPAQASGMLSVKENIAFPATCAGGSNYWALCVNGVRKVVHTQTVPDTCSN